MAKQQHYLVSGLQVPEAHLGGRTGAKFFHDTVHQISIANLMAKTFFAFLLQDDHGCCSDACTMLIGGPLSRLESDTQ